MVTAIVAKIGIKREHLEAGLGVSHDTLTRQLASNPDFEAAYNRGLFLHRQMLMGRLQDHSKKNALVALAMANQPNLLGWENPTQRSRIEGRIDHVHSMSPAQLAFLERREMRQLRESPKGDLTLISDADKARAETIEK